MRAPRRGTAGAAAARSRCREVSRGAGSGTREKARQWRRLSESRPPSTAERGEGRARTHGLSLSSSRSASSAAMVLARREASRGVPPSAPPRAGNRRRKPKTNLTPTLARRGCARASCSSEPNTRSLRARLSVRRNSREPLTRKLPSRTPVHSTPRPARDRTRRTCTCSCSCAHVHARMCCHVR